MTLLLLISEMFLRTWLRIQNAVQRCNLKNDRMIPVRFQGKPFNITVIQLYALTNNGEKAEVEHFYDDLQDLLELTPTPPKKKKVVKMKFTSRSGLSWHFSTISCPGKV